MVQRNNFHINLLLQKCAILCFVFLPIVFSLAAQLKYILSIWKSYVFWGIGFIFALVVFPLFVMFYKKNILEFVESKHLLLILWLVALGVGLRSVLLPIISTNFVSDMEDIHNFAVDFAAGNPLANLQNYPNIPRSIFLNMSGLALGSLYKIFPPTFTTAKICMVFFSGLTIWLLFKSGQKISNSRVGFISALVFAVTPSLVLYTGVLSGEHVAVFLITAIVLFFTKLHENKDKKAFYLIGYLLLGCMIGLVDWFRPNGLILLISISVANLLYTKKRELIVTFIALVGLFVGYIFINNLAVKISERTFGVDVLPVSQRLGHYLLVGLNPETGGQINDSDYGIAINAYEAFGDDHLSAQKYLIQLALDRLKGHSILKLFWEKFDLIWANQDALFDYALIGSNDQEMVMLMRFVEVFLYLIITIFIGIHAVKTILRRSSPAVFVMQLFVLGFALLLLLVEVQNRYVIVVFPYLILLGTLGIEESFGEKLNAS